MKKLKIYFFLLTIFLLVDLNSNLRETVRYENYLQNQLESYLGKILPPKSFVVSVSVQIKKNRVQELKKESTDTINKEDSSTPVFSPNSTQSQEAGTEDSLPGLEFLDEEQTSNQANNNTPPVVFSTRKTEQQEKVSREFDYNEEITIEAIDTQIILDESIPVETINTIRQVINDKFDSTYQDRAVVNFVTSRLSQSEANQIPNNEEVQNEANNNQDIIDEFNKLREDLLNSDDKLETFKDYLDNYGIIFYLLFGLIFLFFIFLFFFFFIWFLSRLINREPVKTAQQIQPVQPVYPPPNNPYNNGNERNVNINERINLELDKIRKQQEIENERKKIEEEKLNLIKKENEEKIAREREKFEHEKKKLEEEKKSNESEKQDEKNEVVKSRRIKSYNYVGEENEFIDVFLEDTLTGRKYVLNLSEDEFIDLLHSFSNPNVQKVFADLKNERIIEEESPYAGLNEHEINQSKKRLFSKHLKGISQYRKILREQTSTTFGKLSLLQDDEIKLLFSSLSVDVISDLSRLIDSNVLKKYMNSLTDRERQNLIKAINQNKEISYEKIDDLKAQFEEKIKEISKTIFIQKSQKSEIMKDLLVLSDNKKDLLDEMKKDNIEFYNRYKAYQTTFIEFINQGTDLKNKIIDDTPNETIAEAAVFLSGDNREALFASLPENRRELVEGLIATKGSEATKEQVKKAQEKILDRFREVVS